MDRPDYPVYRSDANDPVEEEAIDSRERSARALKPGPAPVVPGPAPVGGLDKAHEATGVFIHAEKERVKESKTLDRELFGEMDRP